MIPNLSIVAIWVNLALTTVVPIVIIAVLLLKKKINLKPVLLGGATFIVSQILLRIPLMNVLSGFPFYQKLASNIFIMAIFIGGFTAGLFEETGRLLSKKLFLKDRNMFKDALGFGLGHAFIEVIVLIGMGNVNNLIMVSAINNNTAALMPGMTAEILAYYQSVFAATSPIMYYIGTLERVFAVTFHIFATVLVFLAVQKKKIILYVAAILAHTVFNASAVLIASFYGIYISELVMAILAVGGFIGILKLKGQFAPLKIEGNEKVENSVEL